MVPLSCRGIKMELPPFLVRTHCIAHRLALASEKACKQVPYMVKFIEVINRLGIYKLCKFSPKFCRELEKCKLLHGNILLLEN